MREILTIARALGDESRLRALLAVRDGKLCVCQLIRILGLSPATVSKHLNILEQAGLVTRTRQGKWRFYQLAAGSKNPAVKRALEWVAAELRGDPRVVADARRTREVRRQDLQELSACYRG